MKSPAKMTEDEFRAEIIRRCAGRDLWPVRVEPERFNQRGVANKGFPDLMVFGPGGVLFCELKSVAGNGVGRGLKPAQSTWKHRLLAGGLDWVLWTPDDLASGRVDAKLHDLETPDEYSDGFSLAMARIA